MSRKPTSKRTLKTLRLTPCDGDDALEPPAKKHRARFMLSTPPVIDLINEDTGLSSSSQAMAGPSQSAMSRQKCSADVKGKGKERSSMGDGEDTLWVDKYEPTSEAELAVHKRKIEDVRRWLLEAFDGGPSGKLRKYRRILALTGPAGTAKTATLRVLSRELDFEILEWRNSMSERGPSIFPGDDPPSDDDITTESLFDKFQAFLTRATTCKSIFGHRDTLGRPSQTHSSDQRAGRRQLVLLEDLPNLLHQPTQVRFQAALRSICTPTSCSPEQHAPPIVVIVSDSGLHAEHPDDDIWDSGNGRKWGKKEVLDIRNVLGPELLTSPYVTRIGYNPIASTLMTKALQVLLAMRFGSMEACERGGKQPSREVIDIIVESSNGDIRSAIMALQFACMVDLPASTTKSKGKVVRKNVGGTKTSTSVRAVLEAVTRREQSLVLFHLMGKILYNKRKFDPPAARLSAKDTTKEREHDLRLADPPPLPTWLSHHERKASRVCVETLAADSPIDSSLLAMYTYQNYTLFCTDIDQCDGICEGLSWVDCMNGTQSSASPYAFPTLTLSTLHALPTPVPRRGQKVCKPAWFDVHARELEAADAAGDVLGWLGRGLSREVSSAMSPDSVGKWTQASVATELGGWLRALDRYGGGSLPEPPRTHRLFSHLPWDIGVTGGSDVLGENDGGEEEEEEGDVRLPGALRAGDQWKGWLEDDDIEDVE